MSFPTPSLVPTRWRSWPGRGTRKLAHLHADPTIAVVVRAGWQWTAVEGTAQLIGPDDPDPNVDAEQLLRIDWR